MKQGVMPCSIPMDLVKYLFGQTNAEIPRMTESPYLNNDVLSAISFASHTFKACMT